MLLFYPYFKIKVLTYLLVGLLATQLDTDLCIHFSILYKSIEGKNCQNLQNLDNIYAKILPRTLSSGAVLGILRRSDASSMAASTAPFELQAAGLGASSTRHASIPAASSWPSAPPHLGCTMDLCMAFASNSNIGSPRRRVVCIACTDA